MTPAERFWARTSHGHPDECWPFNGAPDKDGYRRFRPGGAAVPTQRAHRVAYALWIGPVPDGCFVLHSCDNPACVNPGHLWAGTHDDNMRDCRSKGRRPRGAGHHNAVLTEQDVRAIKQDLARGLTCKAVADAR